MPGDTHTLNLANSKSLCEVSAPQLRVKSMTTNLTHWQLLVFFSSKFPLTQNGEVKNWFVKHLLPHSNLFIVKQSKSTNNFGCCWCCWLLTFQNDFYLYTLTFSQMTHSYIFLQDAGVGRMNERLRGQVQPKDTTVYCVKTVAGSRCMLLCRSLVPNQVTY